MLLNYNIENIWKKSQEWAYWDSIHAEDMTGLSSVRIFKLTSNRYNTTRAQYCLIDLVLGTSLITIFESVKNYFFSDISILYNILIK